MIINRSKRKRASNDIPSESYPVPEFEQGIKVIPDAELEHVAPFRQRSEQTPSEEQMLPRHPEPDKLAVHIQKIDKYIDELSALATKIEQEQEIIKRISGLKE
ncbi:MAG: hypothetical protein GXY77_15470 [Fibrobacter sp.]|nr:hypothetical protein [Fibrobacter sp.]